MKPLELCICGRDDCEVPKPNYAAARAFKRVMCGVYHRLRGDMNGSWRRAYVNDIATRAGIRFGMTFKEIVMHATAVEEYRDRKHMLARVRAHVETVFGVSDVQPTIH